MVDSPADTQQAADLDAAPTAVEGEVHLRASFLDALDEAVVATDLDGRIVYWNTAAERLFGWRSDQVLGGTVVELLPAEGTIPEARRVLARLRRGESWAGEFLVQSRDGRVFPVHTTDSPVRDAEGHLIGIVGVSRDVSADRQAREALRESEERLELVHRAASSVIWEWDLRTDRIHWSDAVGESFGYPSDSIEPTMTWWESRIHPDDRERVVEELWDHLSSGRRFYTREYRLRTADGSYATVFDRGHVAFGEDGRPTRVVGTLIDLTERRRHQENRRLLAQSGMILHLSLDYEATLPGIAQLLVHGFAGCALLHIGPHHGVPAFLTAAHADPRQQATLEGLGPLLDGGPPPGSPIARVMRTGESLLITEFDPGVLSDETLPPELRAVLSDLDPESAMVVAITARQAVLGFLALARFRGASRFDSDDLHVAEELARRIGVAVDHARLVHSAALANRAKSDFLAVVNHELRTPLTAVQGYADLLAAEIAGPLTEGQKRQVAGIRSGSDRLLRLIEGILLFARLEAGDERPHFDRVALGPLLERVAALVRPQAAEKGLEFRLEVGDLPAVCCTDPNKLLQILLSLLTNAIKFSERGAVTLCAAARDDQVVFDIADTGTGIAEEHLPHVFNAFWQAEQPATRRAGGAGLGLSVARRLARLLDGDVFAAATSPRGTTFRVLLPVTWNP